MESNLFSTTQITHEQLVLLAPKHFGLFAQVPRCQAPILGLGHASASAHSEGGKQVENLTMLTAPRPPPPPPPEANVLSV